MNIDSLLMTESEMVNEWFGKAATAQAHNQLAQRDHMIKVDETFVKDVQQNLANAKLEKIDGVWYIVANKAQNIKQDIKSANDGSQGPVAY